MEEKRGDSDSASTALEDLVGEVLLEFSLEQEQPAYHVRVLPPRIQEVGAEQEPQPSHEKKREMLARSLAATVTEDFLNVPFADVVAQSKKHDLAVSLGHLDRLRSDFLKRLRELESQHFETEIELERVMRNRAYRGFDYSPEVRRRLLDNESRKQGLIENYSKNMVNLNDRVWIQLKDLLALSQSQQHEDRPELTSVGV